MKRILAAVLLCLLLLAGCVNTQADAPIQSESADFTQDQLFDMLFDIENKLELRLDMADTELQKMQDDYDKYDRNGSKSPIYRKADLHVTITTPDGSRYSYTIPEVGVRMKGNTSRTDFYNANERIYNVIHLKLSFQETFDDAQLYGTDARQWTEAARLERKERTFATLEKLELRWNHCDDGTYMKEYFAYETYRSNGVPAPHTNLCSFDWAGIHMGVFTINEPVDKVFLSKNLPAEALGGDLYKCGWAGSSNASFTDTISIGIEDEVAGKFYAYDLKTNKKTSGHEALTSIIKALNSGDVTKESFAEVVDLDRFLPYCAVSYLLGNPDDLRNNYNNCYIYFREDNGKLIVIPYDFDRCLGITAHWNPTGDGVTSDNPFGTTILANGNAQKSPLILYSVAAGGYYVREYGQLIAEISASEQFRYEHFAELYEIAKANYESNTWPSRDFYNTTGLHLSFDIDRTSGFSSTGNISVQEYLDAKLQTADAYLADIDRYADAEIHIPITWCIRADFTGWQMDDKYTMTQEDGLFVIKLTRTNECRLKVYNDSTGRWYGTECIRDGCAVPYGTDDHTNIVLQPGTYWIRIDPYTEEITLETEARPCLNIPAWSWTTTILWCRAKLLSITPASAAIWRNTDRA